MNDKLTYGATRDRLLKNGYTPTSLINPGAHGPIIADEPAAVFLVSEYGKACGVADADKRNVVVITICARDKKARAEIAAVFSKHGLDSGPRRTDTMGNGSYVVRFNGNTVFDRATSAVKGELDPAVILQGLHSDTRTRDERASHVLRLDGTWTNSTLLETPRSKLPTVDLDALFKEVEALLTVAEPYVEPQLPPELAAKIAARRKELEAQKAEIAERTDSSIWEIVDAAIVNLEHRGGFGATPLDQANTIIRAKSHESRIAHYDAIAQERAEAAELRAVRANAGLG
jgi:hypothetical protein